MSDEKAALLLAQAAGAARAAEREASEDSRVSSFAHTARIWAERQAELAREQVTCSYADCDREVADESLDYCAYDHACLDQGYLPGAFVQAAVPCQACGHPSTPPKYPCAGCGYTTPISGDTIPGGEPAREMGCTCPEQDVEYPLEYDPECPIDDHAFVAAPREDDAEVSD